MMTPIDILSFGHGTLEAEQILDLLHGAGVEVLVDVRSFPASRRHPHVNREAMERWVPASGIEYRWIRNLGGFRPHTAECEHDVVWRNASFRNYAGYTRSPEFRAAIVELLMIARQRRVAYMCSESVWWKCHRRLISDFLVCAQGVHVRHLMHDGSLQLHKPTDGLRLREDGLIVYDAGPQPLLPGF